MHDAKFVERLARLGAFAVAHEAVKLLQRDCQAYGLTGCLMSQALCVRLCLTSRVGSNLFQSFSGLPTRRSSDGVAKPIQHCRHVFEDLLFV